MSFLKNPIWTKFLMNITNLKMKNSIEKGNKDTKQLFKTT